MKSEIYSRLMRRYEDYIGIVKVGTQGESNLDLSEKQKSLLEKVIEDEFKIGKVSSSNYSKNTSYLEIEDILKQPISKKDLSSCLEKEGKSSSEERVFKAINKGLRRYLKLPDEEIVTNGHLFYVYCLGRITLLRGVGAFTICTIESYLKQKSLIK